nr:MAG TPA: hypothetical protein [Caudoviricetes sp.]
MFRLKQVLHKNVSLSIGKYSQMTALHFVCICCSYHNLHYYNIGDL